MQSKNIDVFVDPRKEVGRTYKNRGSDYESDLTTILSIVVKISITDETNHSTV